MQPLRGCDHCCKVVVQTAPHHTTPHHTTPHHTQIHTCMSSSLTENTGRNLRCSAMVFVLANSLTASDFFKCVLNCPACEQQGRAHTNGRVVQKLLLYRWQGVHSRQLTHHHTHTHARVRAPACSLDHRRHPSRLPPQQASLQPCGPPLSPHWSNLGSPVVNGGQRRSMVGTTRWVAALMALFTSHVDSQQQPQHSQ